MSRTVKLADGSAVMIKITDDAGVTQTVEAKLNDHFERIVDQSSGKLTDSDGLFFQRQLEAIEAETYDILYPDLEARECFVVNTFGGPAARALTYRSYDRVGKAQVINARAIDLPKSDISGKEFSITVRSIGCMYDWDIDEVAAANMTGMPLEARKSMAARRGYEEYVNRTSWLGDENAGLLGFFSAANNVRKQSVVNGAAGSTNWNQKTPDEIIADLNHACSEMFAGTLKIHRPAELWLPVRLWNYIRSTPRSPLSDTTILSYFLANNEFITDKSSVKPLNVLDGAIDEGDHFIILNKTTPEGRQTVRLREPLPLQFQPVQLHGMVYEVPGRGRFAGVEVTYPRAMEIWYGI